MALVISWGGYIGKYPAQPFLASGESDMCSWWWARYIDSLKLSNLLKPFVWVRANTYKQHTFLRAIAHPQKRYPEDASWNQQGRQAWRTGIPECSSDLLGGRHKVKKESNVTKIRIDQNCIFKFSMCQPLNHQSSCQPSARFPLAKPEAAFTELNIWRVWLRKSWSSTIIMIVSRRQVVVTLLQLHEQKMWIIEKVCTKSQEAFLFSECKPHTSFPPLYNCSPSSYCHFPWPQSSCYGRNHRQGDCYL